MKKNRLATMTWQEAGEAYKKCKVAVMPTGSFEQHGPFMPINTDAQVSELMCNVLADKLLNDGVEDVIFLPPMRFGYCDYHADFPGTISISENTLRQFYLEILDCVTRWGIDKIVFFNNHGGNTTILRSVGQRLRIRGIVCAIAQWWEIMGAFDPDWAPRGHADINELSVMLKLDPGAIDMTKAFDPVQLDVTPELKLDDIYGFRFKGIHVPTSLRTEDASATGNLWELGYGTPFHSCTDASVERGEKMIEAAVNYYAEFIEAFKKVKVEPVTFPSKAYAYGDQKY